MELYFAEEAVGLAKSLNWKVQIALSSLPTIFIYFIKVIKGPYWKEDFDN